MAAVVINDRSLRLNQKTLQADLYLFCLREKLIPIGRLKLAILGCIKITHPKKASQGYQCCAAVNSPLPEVLWRLKNGYLMPFQCEFRSASAKGEGTHVNVCRTELKSLFIRNSLEEI